MVREHRRHYPRAAAVYLSAEQFTTGYVDAVRGSGLPSFRQKCRGAELLVIDDLQFLVGKQRTLEELQYTMDYLLNEGRQLVLGSDRSLAELHGLGVEMKSRLAGGLLCQIEPPEFATRLTIARSLSGEMGLTIGDEVLRMIAGQIAAGAPRATWRTLSIASDEPGTRATNFARAGRSSDRGIDAAHDTNGSARRCTKGRVRSVWHGARATTLRSQRSLGE